MSRPLFRTIERACRRIMDATLVSALHRSARRRNGDSAIADNGEQRVLFLRPDRIGDMIVSTGLLRAIARSGPSITVDVLASGANADIARHVPEVANVVVLDRGRPWRWPATLARMRAARYDAVIDCMPTAKSTTTLLLMLASGAPRRIGVAGRGCDDALTDPVPPRTGARHIVEQLSALAAAFGVDVERTDFSPALHVTDAERRWAAHAWRDGDRGAARPRRLLVNVSARGERRLWPAASYVEVLQSVRQALQSDDSRAMTTRRDVRILVIGAPGELDRARAIALAGGAEFTATASIHDAIALVATADVVLSPDTSITNAAVACRTPVVVMCQPGKGALWGLYGTPGAMIESDGDALATIPAARVAAAVRVLLRSPSGELADVRDETHHDVGWTEREQAGDVAFGVGMDVRTTLPTDTRA